MDVEFLRYKFDNGYYGVITKNGLKIGVRHIQMVYMLANAVVLGLVRGGLGIAVLATTDMTRPQNSTVQNHNWDNRIQGAVLSSFFFGYALMLVPSELFFKRIGGKWIMTAVLLVNGALTVAMPTITNKGGWVAVCNANLFMGMSHASFFAVNQAMVDRWLPPNEKKYFSSLIFAGIHIGTIIALPVTGLISTAELNWQLVYYFLAMVTLAMAVISGTLTASTPDEHQAVGDTEKEYIKETLDSYRKKDLESPWRNILKSPQFWAVCLTHAATNSLFIFYLTHVPSYIMTFRLSVKDSSYYSMYPFIGMLTTYYVLSPIYDWIYNLKYFNYIFSVTVFRKVINCLGALGVVMGLTVLPNFPVDWNYSAIVVLTTTLGMLGCQFCGFLTSFRDMSENYSGTLMMISSTFSSFVGAAVPFITGLILGDNSKDPARWRVILLTIASFYIVVTAIYTTLGTNKRQYWDLVSVKRFGNHNRAMDVTQVQLDEYHETKFGFEKHSIDTAV